MTITELHEAHAAGATVTLAGSLAISYDNGAHTARQIAERARANGDDMRAERYELKAEVRAEASAINLERAAAELGR